MHGQDTRLFTYGSNTEGQLGLENSIEKTTCFTEVTQVSGMNEEESMRLLKMIEHIAVGRSHIILSSMFFNLNVFMTMDQQQITEYSLVE